MVPLLARRAGVEARQVVLVEHGFTPPPSLEGRAAVYVLHLVRRGGQPDSLYVGETGSVRQRLHEHRAPAGRFGDAAVLRAAVVAVGDRSQARRLETALINDLKAQGYDLESSGDGHNILY